MQNHLIPFPKNDPIRGYLPGSSEKIRLKQELEHQAKTEVEIPCIIDGKRIFTGNTKTVVMPHQHSQVLARFHLAGPKEIQAAIQSSLKTHPEWSRLQWQSRANVLMKAAALLAGPHRDKLNAATMLGQSKNAFQAEIDAACELIDFLNFNCFFYEKILSEQPISPEGTQNRLDYRPLEGFVFAITPFNFTAIAGNLPTAPALCGNTVVWKPSDTQVLSAYYTYLLLEEAGLPPGVINFIPADGPQCGDLCLGSPDLAAIHFTGSTSTFQTLKSKLIANQNTYRSDPRMVAETGGKDFIFAHPSADPEALSTALIRGAFEYQGQKCSAASRAYIPESLWKKIKDPLLAEIKTIQMGDVRDFRCFVNAVIDERSFNKISTFIQYAKESKDAEILAGGKCDKSTGYFVEPTLIQAKSIDFKTMREEIFGPVLTIYVYAENQMDSVLDHCDRGTPYGLTGAIFAQDQAVIENLTERLRYSAGNFYINDKPTGAVVGQQPFGGGRASGTNDKAGSPLNLLRWISPRSIKHTFVSPKNYRYPFLTES